MSGELNREHWTRKCEVHIVTLSQFILFYFYLKCFYCISDVLCVICTITILT